MSDEGIPEKTALPREGCSSPGAQPASPLRRLPVSAPTIRGGHLLAALALLACCTSELEGGRYACVFDGGRGDSCPGDYRCGLENYCHRDNDSSRPWLCVASAQCELNFTCGFNRARDAGECHDPELQTAFDCVEDRQCSAGWRCGFLGACQNPDAGLAYPCPTDGGGDSWCEQRWRCAPEGACVDPRDDALLSATPPAVGAPNRINPVLPDAGVIEKFSVSPLYLAGRGRGLQTVAWVQDGTLNALVSDRLRGGAPLRFSLGPFAASQALAAHGSRGDGVDAFAPDDTTRLFFTRPNGQVALITLSLNGSALTEDAAFYFATRLKPGSAAGTLSPRMLSFNPASQAYTVLGGGASYAIGRQFIREGAMAGFLNTPGNAILDVAAVRAEPELDCVFAVDRRGLWASHIDATPSLSYGFVEVQLPPFTNDRCSAPTPATHRIGRLTSYGRDWLGVTSTPLAGGKTAVSLIDLSPLWIRGGSNAACNTALPCLTPSRLPVFLHLGPCEACPSDELLDFSVVVDSLRTPHVEVRCGSPDGGASGMFSISSTPGGAACNRVPVDNQSDLFTQTGLLGPAEPVPGLVGWASPSGDFWAGDTTSNVVGLRLDRAPAALARRGPLAEELIAFSPGLSATPVAGWGLFTALNGNVTSSVERQPGWVVTEDQRVLELTAASLSEARLVALVATTITPPAPVQAAVTARSGSMATVLVAVAGSSVFSAELGAAPTPRASLRGVSPTPLTSIAFPPDAPSGLYLRGYGVNTGGLVRLTADTSTHWTFTEVGLPAGAVPQEVWFEGDRGRVGTSDGTVYSLPSRVRVAPSVPGAVAVDYAQACGQQLLLAGSGLYRLEPNGTPLGSWNPVPLPAGFAAKGFTGGRLHGLGKELYVFTRTGEAAQLTMCP